MKNINLQILKFFLCQPPQSYFYSHPSKMKKQTTLLPPLNPLALIFHITGLGMQTEMIFGRMTRATLEVLGVRFLFDLPSSFFTG